MRFMSVHGFMRFMRFMVHEVHGSWFIGFAGSTVEFSGDARLSLIASKLEPRTTLKLELHERDAPVNRMNPMNL
jgi:hypothetical protein